MSDAITYRRLRAPHGHGQALVKPSLSDACREWEQGSSRSSGDQIKLGSRTLEALRNEARRNLVRLAKSYTHAYQDGDDSGPTDRIILAGHQPELFHPGVWFKNFVLSSLAIQTDALAVNLLIDSHPLQKAEIVVPTGRTHDYRTQRIAFDSEQPAIPYEERRCLDPATFSSFGSRVADILRTLVPDPLITEHWPLACEALKRQENIGQALAQFRHRIERKLGLKTLELPLSSICDSEPFWWFASSLLNRVSEFAAAYNKALEEYRQAHRIRNQAQPLPDLKSDGEWTETVFWIWSEDQPKRKPLFAKIQGNEMELSDLELFHRQIPVSAEGNVSLAVDMWSSLRKEGWRLRPRALAITLFARLVLSDLFIHGIGGAKYDQVTDRLCNLFFGFTPPDYLTVTATAMLPVEQPPDPAERLRNVQTQLRKLRYHPEKHCQPNNISDNRNSSDAVTSELKEVQRWTKYKQSWIARNLPRGSRRERHAAIEQANQKLQRFVADQQTNLESQQDQLLQDVRDTRVLASREYAFCLFPEQFIAETLQRMCD